jgi:hypothetical protein
MNKGRNRKKRKKNVRKLETKRNKGGTTTARKQETEGMKQ